jgi:exodeoxyribonuclease V gamma subunit
MFTQLGSLRNLPFRVIAVLGLSEDRYPRRGRELEFDLMAKERRRGDRIAREEDLNLFLDALLAADDVFYLSYVGQDQRGRGELPPSVLVSDLLEYLDAGFITDDNQRPSAALSFQHPLQSFSRRYFTGHPDFFSYSYPLCDALRTAAKGPAKPTAFLSRSLPIADADHRQVTLDQLTAFFRHPVRYFMRNRLGILLTGADGELPGDEAFRLRRYEKEDLQARLVAALDSQGSDVDQRAMLRAAGLLSAGTIGDAEFDSSFVAAKDFVRRLHAVMPDAPLPPQWVEFACAGFEVTGWLTGLTVQGLFCHRAAAVTGRDLLSFWIRHLVLHLAVPAGIARDSRWLFADASYRVGPLTAANEYLSDLLALYREGLTRPLKLFAKSAWEYAQSVEKGSAQPLLAARRVWEGSDDDRFGAGEAGEAYHDLCFGRIDPLDAEFAELALRVYRPLLRARTALT